MDAQVTQVLERPSKHLFLPNYEHKGSRRARKIYAITGRQGNMQTSCIQSPSSVEYVSLSKKTWLDDLCSFEYMEACRVHILKSQSLACEICLSERNSFTTWQGYGLTGSMLHLYISVNVNDGRDVFCCFMSI